VPRGNTLPAGPPGLELSIICVNWNSLDYLRECIASIYRHTHGLAFEIIVVDNASPQGGIETLREQFPQITFINSEANLGFARANNLGFQHSSGAYVLLLNPDTELAGPAINIMLEQIKRLPDAGILGCKLLNTDRSVQTASIQKFPTILNQLMSVEALRLRWPRCPLWDIAPLFSHTTGPLRVEVIPGACMMLKREVFAQAGMLSEDYFMYAEDLDLNYKVKRLGLSSYYIGTAEVIHHGGASSCRQAASQWATAMQQRAMLRLFRKTRGRLYGLGYRIVMGLAAAGRLLLLTLIFPFANKQTTRWAAAKWSTVLKWAIGMDRLAA